LSTLPDDAPFEAFEPHHPTPDAQARRQKTARADLITEVIESVACGQMAPAPQQSRVPQHCADITMIAAWAEGQTDGAP
jgi:hypothetical protein